MTTLHMETERVREVARQMDQKAMDFFSKESSLRSASGRLSGVWHSNRADRFVSNFNGLLRSYESQVRQLQDLALRLSHEVDEWQAVDNDGPISRQWQDKKTFAGIAQDAMDTAGLLTGLGAAAYITSQVQAGTSYAGELKFYGPELVKDAAGISSKLTHSGVDGFANNLIKNGQVIKEGKVDGLTALSAGLEITDKGINDWNRYDKGTDKAAAITVDTAFVVGKTFGGVAVQSWVMGTLGVAAMGALVTAGAPALLVVGAGFAIWYGSGLAFDWLADHVYDAADNAGIKDTIVHEGGKLLDAAGNAIADAAVESARAVDSAMTSVIKGISSLF